MLEWSAVDGGRFYMASRTSFVVAIGGLRCWTDSWMVPCGDSARAEATQAGSNITILRTADSTSVR
jgi:hypothetical protein